MRQTAERCASSCAVCFLLAAPAAYANDVRTVPAAGVSLTYRVLSSMKVGDAIVTTGQVYTYIVTASDGALAEGKIKLGASIYGCVPSNVMKDCAKARKAANARQEGDLVVVPVPPDLVDRLAEQSSFRFRHFMPEMRRVAWPVPRSVEDPDDTAFSPEPGFITTNAIICPETELKRFLPIGAVPAMALWCRVAVAHTAWPAGHLTAIDRENDEKLKLSYQGKDQITLPSGTWNVQNLSYKYDSSEKDRPAETEIAFSERLGVGVKSHVRYLPAGGSAIDLVSELISVEQ